MQVLQTNKRISKAGQTVWTHTKRQTGRALRPPKALLARLHRGSQEATDDSDEDVEGRSLADYRWALPACREPLCLSTMMPGEWRAVRGRREAPCSQIT